MKVFYFPIQYTKKIELQIISILSDWISGFFDHQYLQKKLIALLDFLHRNNHQKKGKSKTNTFSWVWVALSSYIQISGNFQEVSLGNLSCGVRLKRLRLIFLIGCS